MEDRTRACSLSSEDDDIPRLSAHTLAALQEFLHENQPPMTDDSNASEREEEEKQSNKQDEVKMLPEEWRLSQFWYDNSTASTMAEELRYLSSISDSAVACVSCPTLYVQLKRSFPHVKAKIFEYDERFSKYAEDFVFYDYNEPEVFPSSYSHQFQIVVADPPYLSEECLAKVSRTMLSLAAKDNAFLLLLTGKVQQELAERLLNMHPCGFQPMHNHKLGNEFMLFTNYDPKDRLGGWATSN
eukprot:TRINITY_DN31092_c0_g1_i1.p1 TRINITY_DN31092_c0_g1~~TRINITY_DN31092_c0_g1_i1.p1  ORF type:complete len:242 (+),score=53.82 TRINITY_DN31092_c0_g1_i1:194-919(+)